MNRKHLRLEGNAGLYTFDLAMLFPGSKPYMSCLLAIQLSDLTSIIAVLWVSILSVLLILGLYSGLASARDEVYVYDQRDWKGDRFCTSESIRNLADEDWNDDIASIEVDEGIEVILYEDSNFRGQSFTRYGRCGPYQARAGS